MRRNPHGNAALTLLGWSHYKAKERHIMSRPLRSATSTQGRNMAGARALWRATGMTDGDFGKPIIAIANSYTQFVPGHVHLKNMGDLVAGAIEAAGGVAKEFNTIAVDDGIAMGHDGMLYSLPSRDLIADCVETMVNAHRADALVCISNCDKITPGMLLAAMRLNIPTIFVSGGPMESGAAVDGVELIGGQMVANKLLLSQKIFYFHMPVALVSFCALAFACYYSVRFLATKNQRFDTCAKVCMEISLVFVVCTMITGDLWERFEWGVWWTWDPRLTTYLILMLIIIAYFILRNAIDEPERRATYGAVLSIIALIDVPICFMVTRLIPSSIHPVVVREGGMSADMGITLMFCLVGIMLIGFALYRFRFRQVRLTERVEALKEQLED